jgi:hypothetical protein
MHGPSPTLFPSILPPLQRPRAEAIARHWLRHVCKPTHSGFLGGEACRVLAQSWHHHSPPQQPPSLAHAPFRLLSIVYRPDLARLSGNSVCGDELRFTFSVFDKNGAGTSDVSVIFEAVLPCQPYPEFHQRVTEWRHLPDKSNYVQALATRTQQMLQRATYWRFRTVTRIAAEWRAREFAWSPQSNSLQSIPMEQNFDLRTATQPAFLDYVRQNQQQIRSGLYSLPQGLLSRDALMKPNQKVLCLPNPFQDDETPRVILSRNTCTGCHTTESGAAFVHIRARPLNEESQLSRFLTGRGDDWSQPHAVSITPDNCAFHPFPAPPRQHFYNDLLRRHLFLRAVLATRPAQFSPSEWNQRIHPYSIGEVH